MRFTADVSAIGVDLPAFPVTASSGGADSAGGSVSMLVVRKVTKIFLVAASLRSVMLSTDVERGAAFFGV
jgi:hypothetical protein